VTVDQAREAAKHHNGVIALGGDPVADRKRDRTAKTWMRCSSDTLLTT
jgi:hypothetical protein